MLTSVSPTSGGFELYGTLTETEGLDEIGTIQKSEEPEVEETYKGIYRSRELSWCEEEEEEEEKR